MTAEPGSAGVAVRGQAPLRTSTLWHLVWLGMLLFQPLYDDRNRPLQWAVALAVVVVFLPIYVLAHRGPGPVRRWALVTTTVLGVLAAPVNSGASVLFVYAAAFAGSGRTRRVARWWLAGLTALVVVLVLLSSIPMPWRLWAFAPSLVLVWVVGLVTIEEIEEGRANRIHNARVEHLATLSERERISRDLHDLLGQTLTGIVVRSQLAQRLARTDAEAGIAEMAEVEQAARAALTEVRATVSGWRQVDLDDELAVSRSALTAAGVTLEVTREPGLVLTPSAETALGLALREGVTNVVRHADARHCTVTLHRVGGRVVLEVADDGVGGETPDGNGLTGMRERIAALGGEVQRRARGGTALTVTVPAAVAT
ncbi:sensor histidine kinase [Pseudonocardia xinjiangensis]|uniref:Sensor histidine kinase n=1 Tax=Pseudonocardia xinjiangensis TaxID=75289 RepID=A0ABX1RHN9_9PSEU|nr:sensor histidine kinase [Pseudonocardia xinjiangensis]NMH79905.1 sensor histidine kinase [Pseudonocardia xinjiangensis]